MQETKIHEILKQGEEYFSSGAIEEAKKSFERILSANPEHLEAANNLGAIYFEEGNLDLAISSFRKVLGIDNDYIEATENLGKCLELKGNFLEALKLYQRALQLGGLKVDILNFMANCFIQLGDLATAKKVLNESLRIDGSQENVHNLLREIEKSQAVHKIESVPSTPKKRLNIGFVSIWFERGQSYVTKTLRDVVAKKHNTFVFARTGGVYGQPKLETKGFWDVPNLTIHPEYQIPQNVLVKWIRDNQLDAVAFNEEYNWNLVQAVKSSGVKVLTYLDYYKEDWKPLMGLYDAVICLTLRTYHLVKDFCNAYHVGWAVNTELFRPQDDGAEKFTFFHNAGWLGINYRKMTPAVILAFDSISKKLPDLTLFIHAQAELEKLPTEVVRVVNENPKITYHIETVPAPGLYHKGQILLFPSKLEGLGFLLLEGMSCGLPVITTDAPPMNEFVRNGENGFLVKVAKPLIRDDNIAFPETIIDMEDFKGKMVMLAMDQSLLARMKQNVRSHVDKEFNLRRMRERLLSCFEDLFFQNKEIKNATEMQLDELTTDALCSIKVLNECVKGDRNIKIASGSKGGIIKRKRPPIIVVGGMNHSGTSCIAEFLIKNGAEPGVYDPSLTPYVTYVTYENILFKNCCINLAKIQGLTAPENSVYEFEKYVEEYDGNNPLILKYPKSVFCLNALKDMLGERMKTVFVMRNALDAINSNIRKTGSDFKPIVEYYKRTYNALLNFNGDVFVACFERIRAGKDKRALLEYCGLEEGG